MNKKGFTLMELLVVVLLISILAAIAVPQYFNAIERQRSVEGLGVLSDIEKAQMRFAAINEAFTTDFSNLDIDLGDTTSGSTYETRNFTYTLNAGNATAERTSGEYALKVIYSGIESGTKELCCESHEGAKDGICDIINVKACS